MREQTIHFIAGVLVGGSVLSTLWGLFWLVIGSVGFARHTCGWRVIRNSLTVGVVPLLVIGGLLWVVGRTLFTNPASHAGFAVMPLLLVGLALRQAPDGQRAGRHMLGGIRQLVDEVLGKHQGCGGCDHEHEQGGCG